MTLQLQTLPPGIEGSKNLFLTGLTFLKKASTRTAINEAYVWFDRAIGLVWEYSYGGEKGQCMRCPSGVIFSTHRGLQSLPHDIVRQVEYERLSRQIGLQELEICFICDGLQQVMDRAERTEIKEVLLAANYLRDAFEDTPKGNKSAMNILTWMIPEVSLVIPRTISQCITDYVHAVNVDDAVRAVSLGILLSKRLQPTDARAKSESSRMIAYRLVHGLNGLPKDVERAILYYRLSLKHYRMNTISANNLGMIYFCGDFPIARDNVLAEKYFQMAIDADEKNCAPRNLAILLSKKPNKTREDIERAIYLLILQISEGNESARKRAKKTLILLRSKPKTKSMCSRQTKRKVSEILQEKYISLSKWSRDNDARTELSSNEPEYSYHAHWE